MDHISERDTAVHRSSKQDKRGGAVLNPSANLFSRHENESFAA